MPTLLSFWLATSLHLRVKLLVELTTLWQNRVQYSRTGTPLLHFLELNRKPRCFGPVLKKGYCSSLLSCCGGLGSLLWDTRGDLARPWMVIAVLGDSMMTERCLPEVQNKSTMVICCMKNCPWCYYGSPAHYYKCFLSVICLRCLQCITLHTL